MATLPDLPKFDVNAEPTSLAIEWNKWIAHFENLMLGLEITDSSRKRALLLYYAGPEVHDVYLTLSPPAAGEDYPAAKRRLDEYFEPARNETFEVYNFRSLVQFEDETIDKYVVRLREAASRCSFTDAEKEIKHQVVFSCQSKKVRRKALTDNPTLTQLLTYARSLEKSKVQAETIEKKQSSEMHKVSTKPGKYSSRKRREDSRKKEAVKSESSVVDCYFCGGSYPHSGGRESCPAFGHECKKCDKPNHFEKNCKSGTKNPPNRVRNVTRQNRDTSSNESSSSEDIYQIKGNKATADIMVMIEGTQIKFQIDSGASANVLSGKDYREIAPHPKLRKSTTKLYPYASKTPLPVIGCFDGLIETKQGKLDTAVFYVIEGNQTSLLGLDTALRLEVVKIVNNVSSEFCNLTPGLRKLIDEHNSLFEGVGKMKDVKLKYSINPDVKPVMNKHRRIPFHLRDKLEADLNKKRDAGIIEDVTEPTGWVSPVVITNRKNGDIRLCVDMTQPNKAIDPVKHVIPTIEDIRYKVNGAKFFSKVDLKSAYHQFELDESSRDITTFATHKGLHRFCRLNEGAKPAAEMFHNEIEKKFTSNNTLSVFDDIFIFGKNEEEHEKAVEFVLRTAKRNGLTLNRSKCEFNKKEITFYGLQFSAEGVRPEPEKVTALRNADPPTSKSELLSFLGMITYSAVFIQNFTDLTVELRKLTHDDVKWKWTTCHQEAFDKIKEALSEECLLSYFNPTWDTFVVCDGSPHGVSGILKQLNPENGQAQIVAYASRTLRDAETRYAQIEREALAIYFSCLKFRIYLLGKKFKIHTDHKPLVSLFNKSHQEMPYRVERMKINLQGYNFEVEHIPGKSNPADFISRRPQQNSRHDITVKRARELEKHVHLIVRNNLFDAVTFEEVQEETRHDKDMLLLKKAISTGKPNLLPEKLKSCKRIFNALSIVDDVIMKSNKIFIPEKLRKRVITAGHDGHQGIEKTKDLLRSKVWYPGIDNDATKAVSSCRPCQASVDVKTREPLIMSDLPSAPWEFISIDFYGPLGSGEYLLSIIDQYSRFPIIRTVRSTRAKATIAKLDGVFSEFGIPKKVKNDP